MPKIDVVKSFNKFTKNYEKLPIPELKIEEGKMMNKINETEKELAKLNETLNEIRRIIREKQQ